MGEHRRVFLLIALAGLALRLLFFVYFPEVTDDSRIYANLATNWLQHGVYGQTSQKQTGGPGRAAAKPVGVPNDVMPTDAVPVGVVPGDVVPTDARLPGYPGFLAAIFWLFGAGNLRAVLLAQILADLGTCLIVADLARRAVSERAAKFAFLLAALCPFLANYAAAELTETLEIFFTALALDCAVAALNRMQAGGAARRSWAATGAAIGGCILLRPDGGILLAAVAFYIAVAALKGALNFGRNTASLKRGPGTKPRDAARQSSDAPGPVDARLLVGATRGPGTKPAFFRNIIVPELIVVVIALAPLVPWTIRNFRTLHHFQPLAPRYANDTNELVLRGFNRWIKTWIVDYVSVEEIYWNVPGLRIDPQKLPARALENPNEKDATLAAIADYNAEDNDQEMTPELDARFGAIAASRILAHPVRYYFLLPVMRIADMWLRPRTELLPVDPRWWEFNDDAGHSVVAVGFGLLNLAYVGVALVVLVRGPSGMRWAGLLVSFLLLRSVFLGTLENPEPRYTLEGYPAVIVLGAALLAGRGRTKDLSG